MLSNINLRIISLLLQLLIIIITLCFDACAAEPNVRVNSFEVQPHNINEGESAEITWTVTGVSWAVINQGIGEVKAIGKLTVWPKSTTTYTITARGGNKTLTKSVTLEVNSHGNSTKVEPQIPICQR